MGKDLKSRKKVDVEQAKKTMDKMDPSELEKTKKIINQYAGKDETELKKQLLAMTQNGKQKGSLNDQQIDGMAQKLTPMLSAGQRKKLNGLIQMLKNQD